MYNIRGGYRALHKRCRISEEVVEHYLFLNYKNYNQTKLTEEKSHIGVGNRGLLE